MPRSLGWGVFQPTGGWPFPSGVQADRGQVPWVWLRPGLKGSWSFPSCFKVETFPLGFGPAGACQVFRVLRALRGPELLHEAPVQSPRISWGAPAGFPCFVPADISRSRQVGFLQ